MIYDALIYNFFPFVLKSAKYNFLDTRRLKRVRFNFLVLGINGRFALLNLYI